MGARVAWCILVVAGLAAGCAAEASGSGETCQRSSQCDPGLACVQGRCSDDLSALSEQSVVPDLEPEPEDAGQDAAPPADPDRDAG